MVLEAFNECAAKVKLNVESISITDKAIRIVGDTTSRKNTLRLFKEIKKANLDISQQRLDPKDGRDNFTITVMPKG